VHLYDKSQVSKVYGVEPNKDHHEGLRRKIKEAGLSDIYEIVPVGVEEMGEKWVTRGEVDCVVTVSASVPSFGGGFSFGGWAGGENGTDMK